LLLAGIGYFMRERRRGLRTSCAAFVMTALCRS
jgi:hypothetical protein